MKKIGNTTTYRLISKKDKYLLVFWNDKKQFCVGSQASGVFSPQAVSTSIVNRKERWRICSQTEARGQQGHYDKNSDSNMFTKICSSQTSKDLLECFHIKRWSVGLKLRESLIFSGSEFKVSSALLHFGCKIVANVEGFLLKHNVLLNQKLFGCEINLFWNKGII